MLTPEADAPGGLRAELFGDLDPMFAGGEGLAARPSAWRQRGLRRTGWRRA
jgi:hypothetical protein